MSAFLNLEELESNVSKVARDALADLAAQTHNHIREQAQNKLHSSRETYLENLRFYPDDGVWIIELDQKAMWIEEGIPPNKEMIDDLLKSPKAKRSKDGSKYMSIPFKQNKTPTSSTPAQKSLTDTIKAEFKRRKIPYGKLEVDASGAPKKGLLHKFDMNQIPTPLKTHNGVGQGHGPIGAPRQGMTGIPHLQGVRVYQHDVKNPKTGETQTKKSIMTFRTVSSKQKGTGMWVHPGFDAKRFLDDARDWAIEQWSKEFTEKIMISISSSF